MIQYNTLNVKYSNSKLSKLKSGIKNGAEVTLNISWILIENFNEEVDFPHKLLTDTQVLKVCKTFANSLSANIKFSQLFKMIQ